jgi:hypothetical protein
VSQKFAWMLVLSIVALLGSVVGCASDESTRSSHDDPPYASGSDHAGHQGSCH